MERAMDNNFVSINEIEKQSKFTSQIRALIQGKGYRAFVITLGCQQNEADSEKIASMLKKMGYEITLDEREAHILIVNTCAIREHAERRALSIIGRFKHYKAKNPDIIIGVCGCMSAQEHRINQLKHSYHYVDFTLGTGALHRLPELIFNSMNGAKRHFDIDEIKPKIAEGIEPLRQSDYKAWVSIMYGCDNFCTYCIVPYVRGRERSRKMEDILSEIKDLAGRGYKDITLLGQNVNSYGKDLKGTPTIADLLDEIAKIDGDFMIHLMTSHPKDASKQMIRALKENPHCANHFHLPLQSGSDEVLNRMNRRYTTERYLEIINGLRENSDDITLTTDIIVGFPGESEKDFEKTLDIIKKVRYDSIFTFIFSPRKGTPAYQMEDQIPEEIKHQRYERLCEVQNEISKEINEGYIGRTIRVLVDGKSKNNENVYTSRTEGNKIVHFECDKDYTGKFINVKITRTDTFALYGEII
ncbi:MAG: tRNA (N6-isopentenyl adenosine(37)-C2)-methylthiotransferase MiaB [Clostridia bacterium]|nr:tRNA (N6-isopentenyl adenosine(37)-C2)-methylthiotransferase MiaB [Clostridia bacterium]